MADTPPKAKVKALQIKFREIAVPRMQLDDTISCRAATCNDCPPGIDGTHADCVELSDGYPGDPEALCCTSYDVGDGDDCVFDPDMPSLAWLEAQRDKYCDPFFVAVNPNLCNAYTYFVDNYGNPTLMPPPGPLWLPEWIQALAIWRSIGAADVAKRCGLTDVGDVATIPPVLMTKALVAYPPGTYVVREWCEIRQLNEGCGC